MMSNATGSNSGWQPVAADDAPDDAPAEWPAVVALAAGASVAEAAAACGLSERSLYRRLNQPEFRRHVDQARGRMLSRSVGKLTDGAAEASEVLRELLQSEQDQVRLAAARSILTIAPRLVELLDIEQRVTDLEAHAYE